MIFSLLAGFSASILVTGMSNFLPFSGFDRRKTGMSQLPRFLVRILAAAGFLALASCSTVSGVGQDVQALGRGVSKSADKVQDGIRN